MSCEPVCMVTGMDTGSGQSSARGWIPDDSTFGARLALVRQRMGWGNLKEAAIECGIPPETWRTWERDGVVPRRMVEISGLIADRTGCDYGWLLAGQRLRGENPGHSPAADRLAGPRDNRPPGHANAPAGRRSASIPRPRAA